MEFFKIRGDDEKGHEMGLINRNEDTDIDSKVKNNNIFKSVLKEDDNK